jgi:hypothetical protein
MGKSRRVTDDGVGEFELSSCFHGAVLFSPRRREGREEDFFAKGGKGFAASPVRKDHLKSGTLRSPALQSLLRKMSDLSLTPI